MFSYKLEHTSLSLLLFLGFCMRKSFSNGGCCIFILQPQFYINYILDFVLLIYFSRVQHTSHSASGNHILSYFLKHPFSGSLIHLQSGWEGADMLQLHSLRYAVI